MKREHIKRLKQKRHLYWGYNRHVNLSGIEQMTDKQLGTVINTPKPCSCFMCRNNRKSEGRTLAELRNDDLYRLERDYVA